MSKTPLVVLFATAWGPKFGGLNAFNVELARALGVQLGRAFDLACVVLNADGDDHEDARKYGVNLMVLAGNVADFPLTLDPSFVENLKAMAAGRPCILIGHDTKGGDFVLCLRDKIEHAHAVLIHHISFGAYTDFKKGQSAVAREKREQQRRMFLRADLCLAVGPMLKEQLADLLMAEAKRPPVEQLVPGLVESAEYETMASEAPPHNFTAFVAGRLGGEDDRIKQGGLAVRAFGAAVKHAYDASDDLHPLRKSPTLRMRGIPQKDHQAVKRAFDERGARVVNFDLGDYTEDRTAYFRDLATSSIALMPSWHEGFGLVAWEAIAWGVPVIIGEQSGVYRLLNQECDGMGLGHSVRSVAVEGFNAADETEPNHSDTDVNFVCDAILGLSTHMTENKRRAMTLRENLRRKFGYTWKKCADDLAGAVSEHLQVELRILNPGLAALTKRDVNHPATDLNIPRFLQPPERRPWRPELGLAPSALLMARDQVVHFHPERESEVGKLLEWMHDDKSLLSIRLVVGPGGMGKTRLAYETIQRAAHSKWHALWLNETMPEDGLTQWQTWLESQADSQILLVIDYVEGRQEELIRLLGVAFDAIRSGAKQFKLRLLLLARTSAWWGDIPRHASISHELAALLSGTAFSGIQELAPWRDDIGARLGAYKDALLDYTTAQQLAPPMHAYVPDLSTRAYDRPLYIHMAAIAAIDGQRAASADSLIDSLLNREWRYWLASDFSPGSNYDSWADALAYLCLMQGATTKRTAEVLAKLDIRDTDGRFLTGLARAYPGAASAIGMLQPDLLAEALIVSRLAGTRGSRIATISLDSDANSTAKVLQVIARLLARAPIPGKLSPGNAAEDAWYQSLCEGMVNGAWTKHPELLIDTAHTLGGALGDLLHASWKLIPSSLQEQIAPSLRLPTHSTPLMNLSVAVARAQLRVTTRPQDEAEAAGNLAIRLSAIGDAGSRQEALVYAREAMTIYCELAESQPSTYLPDLAMSLNNLATHLSEQGDVRSREEALVYGREAMTAYLELAKSQPLAYLPDLAGSVNNLANRLSEEGDAGSREEALVYGREAMTIRRELAKLQPSAYLPDLAMSLNNLAAHLSEQGDAGSREEALAYAREAMTIRRELAKSQPSAYLPDLAGSLNNLAAHLSKQGDARSREEALVYAREAMTAYRELAKSQPSAYLPDLAGSLNNLAAHLSEQGEAGSREEALVYAREAMTIRRELAKSQPSAYLPDLAMSLNNLAAHSSEQGDAGSREEAPAYAREAMTIYRELVKSQPSASLPALAMSLNTVACRLSDQGDAGSLEEALVYAREAVTIHRELAKSQPSAYLPGLAMSLNNLAKQLSEQGDAGSRQEALVYSREAVGIFAWLHSSMPDAFEAGWKVAIVTLIRCTASLDLDPQEQLRDAIDGFEPPQS